ncbi:MAG: hypothetical protein GY900_12335 [Actinomycetia bacterium]|nr:hypothetical protein [Actinomycetes bacterium]
MSYSLDFRKSVIENIESGKSWNEVLKTFSIHRSTLDRWLKKSRIEGSLEDAPRRSYGVRKIDSTLLLESLEKNSEATLVELAREFDCWPHAIHRRLKKLGITRKKNHALRREK